jgi:hypothetical protein
MSSIKPATVIRLDERRAKYLAPAAPTDPFLADAAVSMRVLRAAVRLPEIETSDLRVLLARLRASLDLYVGADALAARLRQEAVALEMAISMRR